MRKYHIIYTLDGQVFEKEKKFESIEAAEKWLKKIGATYWEIGMPDEYFKECFKRNVLKSEIPRRFR